MPRKVKFLFIQGGHECETVGEAGFSSEENGELLALADKNFDVFITSTRTSGISKISRAGISLS